MGEGSLCVNNVEPHWGVGDYPYLQTNRVRKWLWIHKLLPEAQRVMGKACVGATLFMSPLLALPG